MSTCHLRAQRFPHLNPFPLAQNAVNMASGHASALSIISWEGYLSAMFGNTLMCSHFAASGERSAVNVQLVGILNNFLILTQVR